MKKRHALWLLLALLALLPVSCGDTGTSIQGCGSTFAGPMYQRWFLEYYKMHPDVRVNYQPNGSSTGVNQLQEGLVDFCGTDEALSEEKLTSIAKTLSARDHRDVKLLQIPMTAGSLSLCYNIPGKPRLKLNRQTYVGITLGIITFWDDDHIRATNPEVDLPHLKITCVHRADGSGTTFVFTNHLNAIDSRWRKEQGGPGVGKSVQWPMGIAGKGNAGVAALIQQTPGAFGYVETGFAELAKMPAATLENRDGNFVEPTPENAREALQEAKFNAVFGATVPDPKGKLAYPIVTFTWIVCRRQYADARVGDNLKAVLEYCLEDKEGRGQQLTADLGYIPLPPAILERGRKVVSEINSAQQ